MPGGRGLRLSPGGGGGVNPGGGGAFVAAWEQLVCFVKTGERACDPGFLVGRGFFGPSRVPSVSCRVPAVSMYFFFFLIRKSWDTAGYANHGVSRRVAVSRRTGTANRQFLPYRCLLAVH